MSPRFWGRVGPDPGFGVVVDGAQVQVDGLHGAEVAFDPGQTLVGGHDLGRVHLLGGHGGTDDVDPVQGRLGGDLVVVAGEGERVVGVGVGPGRPASLSAGGFPWPALRTDKRLSPHPASSPDADPCRPKRGTTTGPGPASPPRSSPDQPGPAQKPQPDPGTYGPSCGPGPNCRQSGPGIGPRTSARGSRPDRSFETSSSPLGSCLTSVGK